MNTCKECKWWADPEEENGFLVGHCQCPKVIQERWAPCREGLGEGGMDAGWVEILFGQDFGCIHFEKKP